MPAEQKYDHRIQDHIYKQLLENHEYLREQLMMLEPTNPAAIQEFGWTQIEPV